MKQIFSFILTIALLAPMVGRAQCERGAYGARDGDFVVVVPLASGGHRYLFRDGRRGNIADAASPLECLDRAVSVRIDANRSEQWAWLATQHTDVTFSSVGTRLAGQLIEPARAKERPPLVVMVHGSERTPAIGSSYPYVLAAQGIAVFVYDKRGTGASEGEYTQNFELLADDAAALHPRREVELRAIVGGVRRHHPEDRAARRGGGRRRGVLDVLGVDADISNMREGERDDLPGVGGVREDLLVARHGGVEADLADGLSGRPEPHPP
ncbi:MAG: hypothetical protein HC869_25630 [Rhodospirillales bacterium]|nr:hypothetical protein [Rhodospirillales bacterium]